MTAGFRPYLLLTLLCLVLYLPGLASVPPLDRDESRFIQASRQMLETHDFVRIQFQDEMRAKKPVGAYWLQAGSASLFGVSKIWPYRLPSAVAAWAAVLMTFAFGATLVGRPAGLLGALLLAGSVLLLSEAHQAKSDALLLATAVAAQGALLSFHRGKGSIALALLFWVAQGAAILVKGPVVPMISLLTLIGLAVSERRIAWAIGLRPITGLMVAAAMVAPWFAAISTATHGAFVGEAVKSDLLPKLLGSQESHGAPPGAYLGVLALTFWPGSLLLFPALTAAWRQRATPEVRALLAWVLPAWAMFELVPTKLPHYVLPLFPALALLAGLMIARGAPAFQARAARWWFGAWGLIGLAVAAALVVLPQRFGDGVAAADLALAASVLAAALLPMVLALKGRMPDAVLAVCVASAALSTAVFGVLPLRIESLWVSSAIETAVRAAGPTGLVAAAGYDEPSLVVALGTATKLTNGAGAAGVLAADPGALAVVAAPERATFLSAANGLDLVEKARIAGFNYTRGKPVEITVFARRAP